MGDVRELYAYNRWAGERILDAVARVTPEEFVRDLGGSFPSIRDTLVHMMSAEWVWLSRWRGTSPTGRPEGWGELGLDELGREWEDLDRALQRFVGSLEEKDLDRPVAYRNTAGEPFREPLHQLLRHVVNHSSYHRGQVATMLRQLGHEAPTTDLIAWYRLMASAGAPADDAAGARQEGGASGEGLEGDESAGRAKGGGAGGRGIEQRVSLITLGVADLERSTRFYRDVLGWTPSSLGAGHVTFFQLNGFALGLFPRDELARDADVGLDTGGRTRVALAHNVRERRDVDAVLERVGRGGAEVVKPARDAEWGGRSGYFSDPDGFLWEVAWNPGFPIHDDGSISIPD